MNTPAVPVTRTLLGSVRALPALPATIPAPVVSYSFSAWGYINTEIAIDGAQIVFWTEGYGEPVNSTLYTGEPNPWAALLSAADLQAAMAWGEVMHDRVAVTARDFLIGLSTEDFKADLVAVARG